MPNKNADRHYTGIVITDNLSDRAERIAQLSDEVSRVAEAIPLATDAARRALEGESKKLIEKCDSLLAELSGNQPGYGS